MSEENINLTPEEVDALAGLGVAPVVPEGKHNAHSFIHNVATADDTTKTGYLKEEEVGNPRHPTRTYQTVSLIAEKVMEDDLISSFYKRKSEVITATSLSRDGFLTRLAVVQRKELADVTKPKKENKGWFRKKDDNSEGSTQ